MSGRDDHRRVRVLVVDDERMNGMNGFEAARQILPRRPETIVVLVSAWGEETVGNGARGCGAVATLHKRDLRPTVLNDLWAEHGPAPAA